MRIAGIQQGQVEAAAGTSFREAAVPHTSQRGGSALVLHPNAPVHGCDLWTPAIGAIRGRILVWEGPQLGFPQDQVVPDPTHALASPQSVPQKP